MVMRLCMAGVSLLPSSTGAAAARNALVAVIDAGNVLDEGRKRSCFRRNTRDDRVPERLVGCRAGAGNTRPFLGSGLLQDVWCAIFISIYYDAYRFIVVLIFCTIFGMGTYLQGTCIFLILDYTTETRVLYCIH